VLDGMPLPPRKPAATYATLALQRCQRPGLQRAMKERRWLVLVPIVMVAPTVMVIVMVVPAIIAPHAPLADPILSRRLSKIVVFPTVLSLTQE